MVTYDEVKQKAVDLRNSILKAMYVNKPARAKAVYSQIRAKLDSIISDVLNAITAVSHSQLDSYLAELSYSQPATEFGMKTINIAYSGDTIELNGETVIPYDVFSFDITGYMEKLKKYPKEVSRRMIPIRIDNDYTPPDGDWQDVEYKYYLPAVVESEPRYEWDLLESYEEYGVLPKIFEFLLYESEWDQYLVRSIIGKWTYYEWDIDGSTVKAWIASNDLVKVEKGEYTGNFKHLNYKFAVMIDNYYENPIELCYNNQIFVANGRHWVIYVCLADIHLYPAPFKVLDKAMP